MPGTTTTPSKFLQTVSASGSRCSFSDDAFLLCCAAVDNISVATVVNALYNDNVFYDGGVMKHVWLVEDGKMRGH